MMHNVNTGSARMDLSGMAESALLKLKDERGIKGLSCAIFNDKNILWKGGVGKSTYGYGIDANTLFSIQSITKPMTGQAVLIAESQGLLELGRTLKFYLPDFHVNSAFEEHLEEKITLRMLRSHTAGFTHEAPVGNSFDFSFRSYAEHLESIKDTWLKFPVGAGYSYSNLGYDLLAQILEKVTSMKFDDYLEKVIFGPLGMRSTTSDDAVFIARGNKTEGEIAGVKPNHYPIPLIGSASVYSNVEDMVKFVRLYMNRGNVGGRQVVSPELLDQMLGFGLYVKPACNSYLVGSDGGGFGYGATIMWLPAYCIGCVIMGNKPSDYETTARMLLQGWVRELDLEAKTAYFPPIPRIPVPFVRQPELYDRVVRSMESVYQQAWEKYCGNYMVVFGGMEFDSSGEPWYITILKKDDELRMAEHVPEHAYEGILGESRLMQHLPGLFFTKDMEALDLRGEPNTFRNIHIQKVG
jgi:CubicO group peptidase (beta-lactamase class C family)